MYIVTLTYLVDLAQIDAAVPDHAAWLDGNFADGVFLAAGRQDPRVGGVIFADNVTREDLDRRLATDPFHQRGLATYSVMKFAPSRTAPQLASLLPGA